MGISYSAVKTDHPEAWEIGKDYYALTDLFPACAHKSNGWFGNMFTPSEDDIPHIVGSRHIVGSAVFRVTDYYKTAEEMLTRIETLKKRPLDIGTRSHLERFFVWVGNDPIQLIGEFDFVENREAADEYQLCASVNEYRHMDSWNGEANRPVGYESEEDDDL